MKEERKKNMTKQQFNHGKNKIFTQNFRKFLKNCV